MQGALCSNYKKPMSPRKLLSIDDLLTASSQMIHDVCKVISMNSTIDLIALSLTKVINRKFFVKSVLALMLYANVTSSSKF